MKKNGCQRKQSQFKDGYSDGLKPLRPLDLSRVKTINDLVAQMSHTAFGGRSIGEAADLLYKMAKEKGCFVVLTLSGALTVAKMGLVICDLIDSGIVNAVVSTGAIMAHGLVESVGRAHFKYDKKISDKGLYQAGYNRIYDTLELEKNLDDIELIFKNILGKIDKDTVLSSRLVNERLGKYLIKNTPKRQRGILKSAFTKKVPVYIPAFTDSELGLDLALYNRKCRIQKDKPLRFDPYLDLEDFTELIKDRETLGIFTVGGGVPRNWAQQVGPYLDIIEKRIGAGGAFKRYSYGIRICPEPAQWGGLSGCTYSEGISWGKLTPPDEGGRWAEVYADATIALPLIVKAVLERLKWRRRWQRQ